MPSLGPAEIIVILVVALLVFGPNKMPEIARQVGSRGTGVPTRAAAPQHGAPRCRLRVRRHVGRRAGRRTAAERPRADAPPEGRDTAARCADRADHATSRSHRWAGRGRRPPGPTADARCHPSRTTCVVTTDAPRRRLTRFVPLRRRREPDGRMTVVEHLSELRRRLVICIIAVVIAGSIMFILSTDVISFLVTFYKDATGRPKGTLIFTGPLDAFATRLKIATYGGIVLAVAGVALPAVAVHHAGAEPEGEAVRGPVRPHVDRALRRSAGSSRCSPSSPRSNFLLNIGGSDLKALLTADRYISLVALMIVAFGLSFEFPVVLDVPAARPRDHDQQLRQWRRWAIVAIVVFAAVITPSQDPYSLFAMAIPMYVFYEGVIIIGRLLKR